MVSEGQVPVLGQQVPLQWSHVFSDMVSQIQCRQSYHHARLQWSHVFSDMVSCIPLWMFPIHLRFNGAMSFQTW
ncbi:protein of unknown function [Methanoculleus bourgensis]|uniref:Uncharacterized protein n=1 Tax=Methanoculleus bourgensis TaxID=83986 RepID=A0A0X8XZA4_9EURY|nr:protein of unknown function [Methanoculleus bourgensis]